MGGCGPNQLTSLCHIFPNEPNISTHPTWQGRKEGSALRCPWTGQDQCTGPTDRLLWDAGSLGSIPYFIICFLRMSAHFSLQSPPLGKGHDFSPSIPLPFSSKQPNWANSDHQALQVVLHKWALAPVRPPTYSGLSRSHRGHPAARSS